MDQVKFALKIKKARKERGWTQKELAERLQITDKAVSKWERALSMPDIEMLGPISKELNIPLAELLDVEDVIKEGQEETTETLLRKLLPLMKEKVHQEVKKKKKLLCSVIAVWRDKENSEIAYFQFFYYEKPWLIYDSMEEYGEAELTGYSVPQNMDIDKPVSKIVYVDTQEHTLWEVK